VFGRVAHFAIAAAALLFACCHLVLSRTLVPTTTTAARALDTPWPTDRPIRLCALRVEFVPDNLSGTTGTGQMGTGFPDTLIFDPLPHDKAYFEDHLRFLRDYYQTVSAGHVIFDTLVVLPAENDSAYRLNWPMWHYNYNSSDALLSQRLVELFVESAAAAHEHGVDFSQFDAIVVFHAGTGKDFNLGFDATPFDIPSAYISEADIRNFHGTTVPAGVTRGLVLPEGENQSEALDLGIELSVNGILVKLFGNWLGLPDLYNTQTGRSGIGRWGMMDQGSGNVNGLVPAMPDAWSRAFMGWETPLAVVPGGRGDTVRVARFGHRSAPQIVKFPITSREYYLMENRDADADSVHYVDLRDRNGLSLKVFEDGSLVSERGFRVAVRASHYDYGIPGSGILLWHIDENVIARGLADNTVNGASEHRGVDLVEADGAQDIGQEYGFATAGYGAELGVFEDAWYRDNLANHAANNDAPIVRFNDYTFPSARFYDGAYTRLELRSFSVVDTIMSCIASLLDVQPGFPVVLKDRADWAIADMNADGQREIYFIVRDTLFAGDSAITAVPMGVHFARPNVPVDVNGDGREDLLFEGITAGITFKTDSTYVTRFEMYEHYDDDGVRTFPATALSGAHRILLCTDRSTLLPDALVLVFYDADMRRISDVAFHGFTLADISNIDTFPSHRFVLVKQGVVIVIAVNDTSYTELWRKEDMRISAPALIVAEPDRRSIYLTGYGYVNAADSVTLCREPECQAPSEDWDGDGIPDGGGPFGKTVSGREDFPHLTADTSWIIDLNADGYADVLGMSNPVGTSVYPRVVAVGHNRAPFSGLPWAADAANMRPFLWNNGADLFTVNIAQGNEKYYFSVSRVLSAVGQTRFPYRDDEHIINVGPLRPQVHARDKWLYCWPNPTADVSYLRITVDHPAQADVLILDLAGRRVAELHGESALPAPFEISWDVSHTESGVYIGRVTLTGNGDHREGQVKIAVVK
jgi:M6 family metalloprotease-like protein